MHFSQQDYFALPEGFPAQLVGGMLVKSPSPTAGHQVILGRLFGLVLPLAGPTRALVAPIDVVLGVSDVLQPDLIVLPRPLVRGQKRVGVPLAAMEVLSPSTASLDRDQKAPRLLDAGVAEVWLVDPTRGSIERLDATGTELASGTTPIASRALPGLVLVPSDLFD